ncbi:hypothetical protein D186_23731, partial [Citrobacter freundii ATCC 8090 = MTCC 1658 = NBRC 12681]|uniref:hypothetical protein n=1 Tax=Citrobacter freundii TaxID=546 RepID=UPI000299B6DA
GLVTDVTANYIDLDISGFTTGENHSVTAIGLKDYAGNLISPNPVTFTVVNNTVDSVDPSVNALSSAKEGQLTITFSEKVKADANGVIGTYDIGAGPVNIDITNGNATVDSTGTVVTVTAVGFTGVKTVTIDGYKDLSGRTGAAFSRVISFVADTTKPTVSSTKVEKINGVEYLVVEFSENVNVQDDVDITGKVVKNFVESPVTLVTDADGNASAGAGEVSVAVAAYKPVSGKSKAVQINLSNLADGAYTVSLP